MQKQDQKKTNQTKKQTYETPKATELGTVQQMTQTAVNHCGSQVTLQY